MKIERLTHWDRNQWVISAVEAGTDWKGRTPTWTCSSGRSHRPPEAARVIDHPLGAPQKAQPKAAKTAARKAKRAA